jgi:hypothetical protein
MGFVFRVFFGMTIAFIALFINIIKKAIDSMNRQQPPRRYPPRSSTTTRTTTTHTTHRSSTYSSGTREARQGQTGDYTPIYSTPTQGQSQAPPPVRTQTVVPTPEDETTREAKKFIAKLEVVNEKIPDEEISSLINDLVKVTEEIFESVGDKPENVVAVRRFLSYYLPTTVKLLETYVQYDQKKVQTANIAQTKAKIKEMLEKLLEAFYQLHDSLYQYEAMDVMNEISAMESILSSEGLISDKGDEIHRLFENETLN